MSYVKQTWDDKTWAKGQKYFQDALNHMETGIAEGGGGGGEPAAYIKDASVSGKTLTLTKKDDTTVNFTETGKAWTEITLSAADVITMAGGGEIVKDLTTEYDPADFKNDYFLCKVQQTGVDYGTMVYPVEALTSVRVSTDSFTNVLTYLGKSLIEGMNNYGFIHNYYRTMMLFAGTPNGPSSENPGFLYGANVVDGKNVVYVQDVSQQWWEKNPEDSEYGEIKTISREKMETEDYGKAFVFHFKGDTDEINFLFCLQTSQASYWDNTANATRWVDIEAGKFYQCEFDTAHNTLRWLVNTTTVEGETVAVEVTSQQKTAWQNTGINFESNVYAAHGFEDTVLKSGTKIVGWFEEWLSRILSFNEAFGESSTQYLEYIGRPIGFMLDTTTYTKEGQVKIEKNGQHVWNCDVDGVTINLIIPENVDEQGVAHRDTYIMRFDMSTMNSYASLYRHTFSISPDSSATFAQGDTIAHISFCAVNAQAGDSSAEYLLHSDETGQYTDWLLPCSGVVGRATGEGQAATEWFPAIRVIASWETVGETDVRCLYVNYYDSTQSGWQRARLFTDEDAYKWNVRNFTSNLLMVKTPYSGGKY